MAARKLQAEIDRTLKKVQEGSEAFDSIYEKMSSTQNPTQKEKLEADLKTQIKKLQRMRDQIKTWQASSEIKDKTQLVEHRKLIETQMEKFKACEKEMKTKAFSKEGLIAAMRLDPKAQEKLETSTAVSEWVEELGRQIEQAEAEIETLQVSKKKRGSTASERLELLERLNERRRWHINRLEIILRLLDNGSLPPDKVKDLQDDIKYFVESNTDEDFEEDEGLYEDLHLDEVEDTFGIGGEERDSESESGSDNDDVPTRSKDTGKRSSHDDDQSVSSSRKDEPSSPVLKRQPALGLRRPTVDKQEPVKPPPTANFAQQPMASILKHGLPQPVPRPPPLPPVRYATAAAAAVAPQQSTPSQTNVSAAVATPSTPVNSLPSQPPEVTSAAPSLDHGVAASPSLTHPSVSNTSPMLSSASVSQPIAPSQGSRATPPPSSILESTGNSPSSSHSLSEVVPAATSSPQRMPSRSASLASPLASSQAPFLQANGAVPSSVLTQVQQPPIQQPSPLPQQVQQFPQHSNSTGSSPLPTGNPQFPPGIKAPQQQHPGLPAETHSQLPSQAQPQPQQPQQSQHPAEHSARPPSAARGSNIFPGMSDLVASFESAKHKAATRMADLAQVAKVLDSGYSSMPMPQDTEKPKYYAPRNPYATPTYYPQTLLPVLSTPALFAKLDVETLFYVFYYLPGTYFQHLAAQELKRQSWRFHVKYLTWFQRHSEPQAITDEYEQGVYVYFDWEGSWCQRKKSDFRFEYRYLSED